jgi:hypothetical protein
VGLNDTPFNKTISPFPNAIFFASKFNKLFKLLIVFKVESKPKFNGVLFKVLSLSKP